MRNRKIWRLISLVICLSVMLGLSGCSKDTYSQQSKSKKFKLIRVTNVNLSCPAMSIEGDDISVDLTSDNGQDFVDMVTLVTGKKLDKLPETHSFGLSLITYTTQYNESILVYPSNDGSNYMQLFSLNENTCKFIELPQESMDAIKNIFEKYNVSITGIY